MIADYHKIRITTQDTEFRVSFSLVPQIGWAAKLARYDGEKELDKFDFGAVELEPTGPNAIVLIKRYQRIDRRDE